MLTFFRSIMTVGGAQLDSIVIAILTADFDNPATVQSIWTGNL